MLRPVWLLSRDSEDFRAPPLTTGGLKAHFQVYGRTAATTEVSLVHFLDADGLDRWLVNGWPRVRSRAAEARENGLEPILGLSCYTWNVAEFLEIARLAKKSVPEILVVAGGPHVQRAEDYLRDESIDLVVLGEGEATFTELLDCRGRADWRTVPGIAFLDGEEIFRTAPRPRITDLDRMPSPLDVVPLRDAENRALYRHVAYETTRGCPFRCAFCEWGTGALGTKMLQHSLERVRRDLETMAAGGITDLWLCDSNFGALREDEAKADLVIDQKNRTGLPRAFATSWSKNHNRRVHGIVRRLHRAGLLSHYHLALQTLTPEALDLSHRRNMRANDYEPIVRALAAEGVPVAAELIWGLPGETLASFEQSLDHLLTVFPNINIFGYTLLPGTEFFDRRDELRLETVPVAGYGKAKGEYVVGCRSFGRDEGEEGYFLITAWIVLARGQILPRTLRYLALEGVDGVAGLLRILFRELLDAFGESGDRLSTYERRSRLWVNFLAGKERTYEVLSRSLARRLGPDPGVVDRVLKVLRLDQLLAPGTGARSRIRESLGWDAAGVDEALRSMMRPPETLFLPCETILEIECPGGVGDVLRDPDGGEWIRGQWLRAARPEPVAGHAATG